MKEYSYHIPKTEHGMKTFKKIIETGKTLFAINGFLATSINHIIEEADVAAGTFYIYFDNKLALYNYLLDYYRISIRHAANESIKGLTSRYDMEREGLKAFIEYVYEDSLAYKLIWESLFVDENTFKEYYISFSESYVHNLQKAVNKGEIKKDFDLETLSYVLMGISNFVGLQVLFKDKITDEEIDRIVDQAMKTITEGVFTNQKNT